MRARRSSAVLRLSASGLVLPVLMAAMVGCRSGGSLRESVYRCREAAFQDWQREQTEEFHELPEVSGRLTLQDAIKLALLYNKPLQAALLEKDAARGRLLDAYAGALPKVAGAVGYTRLDETGGFEVGAQSIMLGALDNYSVDLQVRQPLFRGGSTVAAVRGARIADLLADESIRDQVQATVFEVADLYYTTLLARHLYDVNREAVVSAEAHLKDVQARFEQDMAAPFDILRAEVDVSNFTTEKIKQQTRMDLSMAALLKVMGVSQKNKVTPADELAYEPIEPILVEAVRMAQLNRPDLHRAELNVRLQNEALRLARSRYWPTVEAFFTQGWGRPHPRDSRDRWGDRWTAGLQLEIPLFDGLVREGRVLQEQATLERRMIERRDASDRVLLEIQQALLALRDAEEMIRSQNLNLRRAREALRLAEVGYREGVNREVDVLEARAALTRAGGLHYQAMYDHTMARLALQRAMGILGPRADPRERRADLSVPALSIEEFKPVRTDDTGERIRDE